MPSSISSSEQPNGRPDPYARETAADRPGIAQPVPLRPVPRRPWRKIIAIAGGLFVLLTGSWELYWRTYGVTPGLRNGYGLWALERRRIDKYEHDATVLLGGSRAYYDIQLPIWQRLTGRRPVQLAFESTSPMTYLENLADDPNFTGIALISVEPSLFFTGTEDHGGGVAYWATESPSQLAGQKLSMYFLEPYLAFDDPTLSVQAVLARLNWIPRPGRVWPHEPSKLAIYEFDRNAYLWDKVEKDPAYRNVIRQMWLDRIEPSGDEPPPERALKIEQDQIARAAAAVKRLRARGVQVLFMRLPSAGPFLAYEERKFPRSRTWEALLTATGAPGIHFQDYPELQGYYLPEWSHLSHAEANRFTEAAYQIIARKLSDRRLTATGGTAVKSPPAGLATGAAAPAG